MIIVVRNSIPECNDLNLYCILQFNSWNYPTSALFSYSQTTFCRVQVELEMETMCAFEIRYDDELLRKEGGRIGKHLRPETIFQYSHMNCSAARFSLWSFARSLARPTMRRWSRLRCTVALELGNILIILLLPGKVHLHSDLFLCCIQDSMAIVIRLLHIAHGFVINNWQSNCGQRLSASSGGAIKFKTTVT